MIKSPGQVLQEPWQLIGWHCDINTHSRLRLKYFICFKIFIVYKSENKVVSRVLTVLTVCGSIPTWSDTIKQLHTCSSPGPCSSLGSEFRDWGGGGATLRGRGYNQLSASSHLNSPTKFGTLCYDMVTGPALTMSQGRIPTLACL